MASLTIIKNAKRKDSIKVVKKVTKESLQMKIKEQDSDGTKKTKDSIKEVKHVPKESLEMEIKEDDANGTNLLFFLNFGHSSNLRLPPVSLLNL